MITVEHQGNQYQVYSVDITETDIYNQVLSLRKHVFIDEQNVSADREIDDYEKESTHWLIVDEVLQQPVAVARSREYQEGCQMKPVLKLERIAVPLSQRGKQLGKLMMDILLEYADKEGYDQVILASQQDVVGFYEKLGFDTEGDPFEDAGIAHRWMRWVK